MEEITLHKELGCSTTTISNRFIDEYMTNANGEFVKIYLYLLRCRNSPDCSFSVSKAADKFNHTENDIQRALKYWEKMNLLQLEYAPDKSISGIYFLDSESSLDKDDSVPLKKALPPDPSRRPERSAASTIPQRTDRAAAPTTPQRTGRAAAPAMSQRTAYTAQELQEFQEKEDIRELMFVAETYLKKPLTSTDIQTLLFWYDQLELSVDLIVYLLEYCIAGGHSSLHYMDRVATNWKAQNIRTVAQAKQSTQSHSRLHYAVMKAMGIQNRSLIPAEASYIDRWNREYGYGEEMIAEACSRTILAIHQPNFEYADRILANWKRQNIQSAEEIQRADAAFQAAKMAERAHTDATARNNAAKPAAANRFNSFPQRTYNMDELETELLNAAR